MSRKNVNKRQRREAVPKVDSMSEFIVDEEEESYDPTVYDHREYFEVDSIPLQKELISSLTNCLKIPEEQISDIVRSVFENSTPYNVYDKPMSWKTGEDTSTIKKIEPRLLAIRNEINEEIPTIPKILSATITKDDKKRCLRFYDQLETVDKNSSDYFRLVDSINDILGKSISYTKREIEFLESEEQKLKNLSVTVDNLKTRILKLDADPQIKAKLLKQYEEMLSYPSDSPFYSSTKEEIEWAVKLPYQKREVDPYVKMNNNQLNNFYCSVRQKLDAELYGMDVVKNRIIHVLNDRRSSGDECGRNIALVGNPGCGKSAVCKVLAKILNKKFAKISAGALDSAAIKGSNKVWTSSEPSIILQILATLKTNNVIIMFDEVDKLGDTPQGKMTQHALLHVSDTADNKEFQDNYLKNFSHDLSKVLFIFCMNSTDCLDSALKDRFDIIHVDDYKNEEKIEIFKNYMLPKALETIGMKKEDVIITDAAINKLLKDRPDISLRSVEKIIKDVIGKINMYRNIILPDGTTGNLKLPYNIPNFRLPLKIDNKLFFELIN